MCKHNPSGGHSSSALGQDILGFLGFILSYKSLKRNVEKNYCKRKREKSEGKGKGKNDKFNIETTICLV